MNFLEFFLEFFWKFFRIWIFVQVFGKEKFDLMTGGGGYKNRTLEAQGLRSLALKK